MTGPSSGGETTSTKQDLRNRWVRTGTFLWPWPHLMVAVTVITLVVVNIAWLERFRHGSALNTDEAGYLSIALDNTFALNSGGLVGLIETFLLQDRQAPLVPLLTVPFQLLLEDSIFAGFLLQECFFALLVFSSYGISRRLTNPAFGTLAALVVATIPMVTFYTREYVFAIDNTALLVAAVFVLLASDRFSRRGWALLFGALVGLGLLARTMTLGLIPGVFLAAALLVVTAPDRRGARAANLGLGLLSALTVAATWYGRNLSSVLEYLLSYGYGRKSAAFGPSYSLLSWEYWTYEFKSAIDIGLYIPLALALIFSSVAGLLAVIRCRRGGLLDSARVVVGHEAFALVVIVGMGYLALSSTSNKGTGFMLPLLPLVVALGVTLLWRVEWRPVRDSLVGGLIAVSVLNAVMQAGVSPTLAAKRSITVPLLGSLQVTNGQGAIQENVEDAGYDVGPATSPMPELHRQWLPISGDIARFLVDFSAAHGQAPVPYFSSREPLFNTNTLYLAARLELHRGLPAGQLDGDVPGDPVAAYQEQLSDPRSGPGLPNFLLTGDPAPVEYPPRVDPLDAERAARSLGFELVKRFSLPDGREVRIWWLDRGPTLPEP